MKQSLIAIALLCGLAGCAGAQNKIDKIQDRVNCVVDLLQPYTDYLTEDQLDAVVTDAEALVKNADILSALEYAGVAKTEIEKVKAGLKECKLIK